MRTTILRGSGRIDTVSSTKSADGIGEGGTSVLGDYMNAMRDMGSDDHGLAVAYTASVWAFRCTNIRANKIASLPHRVVDKETGKPIPNHPLTEAIQWSYTYYHRSLLFDFEASLCIYGEAYLELIRNVLGIVDGLKPLNPIAVEPVIFGSHILYYDAYEMNGGGATRLNPEDMAYYHTYNPRDDLRGLGLMAVALDAVNIDKAIQKSTRSWFLNDSRPDGIISPPEGRTFGDPALKKLQEWWQRRLKGPLNRGKTAILPEAVKWQQIQREPVPEQPEILSAARRDTCAAFGVPLSVAGGWDDASYQSAPEQRRALYEETIFPECDLIAQFFNEVVLPEFDRSGRGRFEFDKSKVQALVEDQEKKARSAKEKWLGGLITMNEARMEAGDQSAGDAGDVYLFPAGYTLVPASQLQQAPQLLAQAAAPFAPLPATPGAADPDDDTADLAPEPSAPTPARADLKELSKWEKAALQNGKGKALRFTCYAVPEQVASYVRRALELTDFADRTQVRAVFDKAASLVSPGEDRPPPEQEASLSTVPIATDAEIEAALTALKLAGVVFGEDIADAKESA